MSRPCDNCVFCVDSGCVRRDVVQYHVIASSGAEGNFWKCKEWKVWWQNRGNVCVEVAV